MIVDRAIYGGPELDGGAVLERIVASSLQNVLGAYFHGVEDKRLQLDVLSGRVVLRNLRVREDALAALQLPYKVKWGVVDTLRISVPWQRLLIRQCRTY